MSRLPLSSPGMLYLVNFGEYYKAGITQTPSSYRWRMIDYSKTAYRWSLPFEVIGVTNAPNMLESERNLRARWRDFRRIWNGRRMGEQYILPPNEVTWFKSLPQVEGLPALHVPKYRLIKRLAD